MSETARQSEDRVQAYLRGDLTEEEAAAFEAAYLDDPVVLDRLETDWLIRQGLEAGAARAHSRADRRWGVAAAVAAVSFALLGLLAIRQSSRIDTLNEQIAALSTPTSRTAIARISAMRDSEAVGVAVRMGADIETAVLVFELSLPDRPEYDLRLVGDGATKAVVDLSDIPVQGAGDLVVLVPASQLPAGDYTATVANGGDVIAEFRLTVQAAE